MTAREFNNSLIEMKSNLQRFAMSLTSDRDTALDLVQDTYLKAITYRINSSITQTLRPGFLL